MTLFLLVLKSPNVELNSLCIKKKRKVLSMRKINNLLTQKAQLEVKLQDIQLQIKLIDERVSLLQSRKNVIESSVTGTIEDQIN